MKDRLPSSLLHSLQAAAYIVILVWGVRFTSAILGPLLLGLMLAYAVVPFPSWLMHRFRLSKRRATTLTVIALIFAGLTALFTLEAGIARLAERVPLYEQRLAGLYDQITVLMIRFQGINPANLSLEKLLTPERLGAIATSVVPGASAIASESLLICLLASLLLMEMLPEVGIAPSLLAGALMSQASYARGYVVVTAKSAGINALINLAFLFAMGVETPILWCVLYFFLAFIPFLGPAIAMVPPIFLTLLMFGWQRAVFVACVLILTQLIVGNVVMPILARKSMSISFLEITLSLVGWSFLLGIPGAIAGIPLTLVLKEFLENNLRKNDLADQASG
ncbi:MAG: AI-2E family transporter [Terracidiphilus sp.]